MNIIGDNNMSWRDIIKAQKPDYLDFDKDGDKEEPMTQALKDRDKVDKSPDRTHYTKDGKVWRGKTHKTDDTLMTGKEHTDDSVSLLHFEDLPESIQLRIESKGSKGNSAFTSGRD